MDPITLPNISLKYLSQDSFAALEYYIKPDEYFLSNTYENLRGGHFNGNMDFMVFSKRKSCYASVQAVMAYCAPRLRSFEPIYRLFNGPIFPQDVQAARSIHCDKFVFHNTDANFYQDARLRAVGLRKIYDNNQIKIYE